MFEFTIGIGHPVNKIRKDKKIESILLNLMLLLLPSF
jgi:hypothetical protein